MKNEESRGNNLSEGEVLLSWYRPREETGLKVNELT